jgi:uncharacterized protein
MNNMNNMNNMNKLSDIPLKNVRMKDSFWAKYQKLVREEVIPYQWRALNDQVEGAAPSHVIKNFKIAAGLEKGEFVGMFFQDTDLAKWLEAVGYSLETNPDSALEALADEAIDLVGEAQQPDGYVNTYYTIVEPDKRWTNLHQCHELYTAGHMIEAAVAYYKGTGKRKLLDIMCRFADYIDTVFGTEPGKLRGYCGHEEIELALVKLYDATGNGRYLKLAQYFVDQRGQKPNYMVMEIESRGRITAWNNAIIENNDMEYCQAHLPVREQKDAVGHAVRAAYLYTAMADIAAETGEKSLLEACRRLFRSIEQKRMYITGGIGSTNIGEAFTFDYDLPNDYIYQETCASIGLVFFAHNLLKSEMIGNYADVMERALYNSVLSGIALDGKSFFYVNPLEVWPEASAKNPARAHVKPVRQKWYGCACCPPNVARMLTSLGHYVYTVKNNTIYAQLYIGNEADMELDEGKVRLVQETNYPWDGAVKMTVAEAAGGEFALGLRIPGWCSNAAIVLNGERQDVAVEKGYAVITRNWRAGDVLELKMDMPVNIIEANPNVRADAGKVAVQRGPLVYCLEEEENGTNLSALKLDYKAGLTAGYDEELFGGSVVIKGTAFRTRTDNWENTLYRPLSEMEERQEIKAVPYCYWGNRKQGEMLVWMRRKD